MLRTPETADSAIEARLLVDPEPTESEPERPSRIVAQRGLFFGPSALVPEDLYSVVERGTAERERDRVRIDPNSLVSTNTYFGRFHATYWQRWTATTEVSAELVVSGSGLVRLIASDTNKVRRIVAAERIRSTGDKKLQLTGAIDRFLDGGGLWLEFSTDSGNLVVSEVTWTVAAPRPLPRTDVVICTYNRVEDCLKTLQAMISDSVALEAINTVHVIDQGSDPLESHAAFGAVSDELGTKLRYARQPNLGGAGGFTRGLFDATTGRPETHADVLLMDDDVMLEPELFIRLTAFAASTIKPAIVGGHMLNLLHPEYLHISAERADPERLINGLPLPGSLKEAHLLGKDEHGLPTYQERRVDTEYNAWWACLIPAEIVRSIGYPLPLFFQWDDVEFGYRARENGFPTVALPGAGVWHADFGWKDWDEWHRYFNLRNGLIMAALHTDFSLRRVTKRVAALLSYYIVSMHYGLSETLLKAVEDFLEGPEILRDGSVEAAAEIRRIRAKYPETVMHPISEIPDDFRELQVVRAQGQPTNERLTFLKRAAYLLTNRSDHRTGLVPAGDAHWWHVSNFERAIVTDMSEQGVRIRTRDRTLALHLAKRGARTLRRLQREAPSVVAQFRAAQSELTSRANWARLYGIDEVAEDID